MSLVRNDIDQEGGHIYSPQEEVVGYSQGEGLDREVEAGQGTLVSDIVSQYQLYRHRPNQDVQSSVCAKNGVM